MDNFVQKIAEQKTIHRVTWDIDKEPTHLPKDYYNYIPSSEYDPYECWEESDKSLRERIKLNLER